MIVVSPDISIFDFKAVFDLTGATPVVKLYNLSSGPNMANISYWFVLTSPSGVVFHQGSEAVPDKVGVWNTEFVLPQAIPTIQGHIDWSGSNYLIDAYAKDSNGTIFQYSPPKSAQICRPGGNKLGQKNNWGAGKMGALMNCVTGKLFIEDKTSYSYNGDGGTQISKQIKLVFPPDSTDVTPPPFEQADLNSAEIPIPYSAMNFQLLMDTVFEYDLGDNVFVRIKYKFKACFDITCGVQLCCILCAIEKYELALEESGCTAAEREKLLLILSKLVRVLAGIIQPLCGVNVPKIISQIKELTGSCTDAEENSYGINPATNCAVPVDLEIEIGEE